jgi:hypothetical protein
VLLLRCVAWECISVDWLPCYALLRYSCRAKQRRQRLVALEAQFEQQAGGGAAAEPHLGADTSDESEGEVAHFRTRQGEVQDAADAGGRCFWLRC